MQLPHNFFEKLRDQITISDVIRQKVVLSKKGHEYGGLCPFHSEKTPSFTVSDQKRFYHCFGCGAHGDAIGFVAETSGMSYKEAAIKLAGDYGIEIPKITPEQAKADEESDQIINALTIANQLFINKLDATAKTYLAKRKISSKIIEDYSIGFAPSGTVLQEYLESKNVHLHIMHAAGLVGKNEGHDIYPIFRNRITFPIKNIYGKIIAFGGRILGDGQPKYLNSPETLVFKKSETLYGEDKATSAAYQKRRIIVVEGYMDVIAMQTAGFTETVATLGTAVTAYHLTRLWRISDEVIFCMDGDNAGLKSMQRAINTILPIMKNQQKASFVVLPDGLDPDDAVNSFGASYMDDLLEQRITLSEMIWYLETRGKKFATPESKATLEALLDEYIALSNNGSLKKYMRDEFRSKIWALGKKKKTVHVSALSPLTNLANTLDIVLYNMFALVLKSPVVLGDEKVYNEFAELELEHEALDVIRMHILELYADNAIVNLQEVEKLSQNSGFFDIFVLLSSRKQPFIDKMSLESEVLDPKDLWKLWFKRYECELLKKEYAAILSNTDDANFDKARLYIAQITKAESDLRVILEEMFE